MEDRQIVDLFWARSEAAITETTKKYGKYCRYIAFNILGNPSDSEEIVNDTYFKVWNTIPPTRPDSLKAYVGMLCRQLAYNALEAKNAKKRGSGQYELVLEELSECIPDSGADVGESVALRDALNRFLLSLPEKTSNVFMRRYWYCAAVAEIAKDFGMKENHVNVLLFNTRKKLKEFLSEEGFKV